MTPIKWVAPNEFYDHNRKPEGGGGDVPVLTLDQIEAWLRTHFIPEPISPLHCLNGLEKERNRTINDLLAQVQAWKEKP
jgi:hypothetical protein